MKQDNSGNDLQAIRSLSQDWVETMVVGLNLCPFASPVVRKSSLRYAVELSEDTQSIVETFLNELDKIQCADENDIATTLLILPNAVPDFYDFLYLLEECEYQLNKLDLEGVFQLASFHPRYLFGGVDPEDISHWTNRSPFPMLHIIREGQMSRVLAHYKNPDDIPERNIQLMQQLGKAGLIEKFPALESYWDS